MQDSTICRRPAFNLFDSESSDAMWGWESLDVEIEIYCLSQKWGVCRTAVLQILFAKWLHPAKRSSHKSAPVATLGQKSTMLAQASPGPPAMGPPANINSWVRGDLQMYIFVSTCELKYVSINLETVFTYFNLLIIRKINRGVLSFISNMPIGLTHYNWRQLVANKTCFHFSKTILLLQHKYYVYPVLKTGLQKSYLLWPKFCCRVLFSFRDRRPFVMADKNKCEDVAIIFPWVFILLETAKKVTTQDKYSTI